MATERSITVVEAELREQQVRFEARRRAYAIWTVVATLVAAAITGSLALMGATESIREESRVSEQASAVARIFLGLGDGDEAAAGFAMAAIYGDLDLVAGLASFRRVMQPCERHDGGFREMVLPLVLDLREAAGRNPAETEDIEELIRSCLDPPPVLRR